MKDTIKPECPHFQTLEEAIRLPNTSLFGREKTHAIEQCIHHCGFVKDSCSDIIHDSHEKAGVVNRS